MASQAPTSPRAANSTIQSHQSKATKATSFGAIPQHEHGAQLLSEEDTLPSRWKVSDKPVVAKQFLQGDSVNPTSHGT